MELSDAPGSLGGCWRQPALNRRDEVMRKVGGPGEGIGFGDQGTTGRAGPDASGRS